jgi:hypothetical protein
MTTTGQGSYKPLFSVIWDHPDFQNLTPEAQRLFLFLRTNRHVNFICLYLIYPDTIHRALNPSGGRGIGRGIDRAMLELIEQKWIDYVEPVIFVVNGLKYSGNCFPPNANQLKGVEGLLKSIPKNPLKEKFLDYYGIKVDEKGCFSYIGNDTPLYTPIGTPLYRPMRPLSDKYKGKGKGKGKGTKESGSSAPARAKTPKRDGNETEAKTGSLKSPACHAYRDVFHLWPNRTQEEAINGVIHGEEAVVKWSAICQEWAMRGNKPTNVQGMLDWFNAGIPPKPNGGKTGGNERKVNDTMSRLADRMREHQKPPDVNLEEAMANGK